MIDSYVNTAEDSASHARANKTVTASENVCLRKPESDNTKNSEMGNPYPLAYYEQLMRHDWHGKVRHRVRQRGWGK